MFRLVRPRLNLSSLGHKTGTIMFRHSTKIPLLVVRKFHHVPVQRKCFIRQFRTAAGCRAAYKEPNYKECPKDGSGRAFYYSLGAVVLGTGAVIAYAKYDDEFRNWLKENVPGSDEFISFVMAEETTHVDYIVKRFIKLKDVIVDDLAKLIGSKMEEEDKPEKEKKEKEEKKKKKYQAPTSAFRPLTDGADKKEQKYDEKRQSRLEGSEEKITTVPGTEKPKPTVIDTDSLDPKSLVELEEMTNKAAEATIDAYTKAVCFFRDHVEEVVKVVEESVDKNDPKVWKQLKQKGRDREEAVKDAEAAVAETMKGINSLKAKVDDPNLPGGPEVRQKAKKNLERVLSQIEDAKKIYEREKSNAVISDSYWKKVYKARMHFADELETLFPNIRLHDKKLKLSEGEFDLFILYMYQNILYYQKELSKLDTVIQAKLKAALEKSKLGDPEAIDAAIEQEIEKEKRKICLEHEKRVLSIKAECEKDMRNQIRLQNDAASDLLEEAIAAKEAEMERKMKRQIDDKLREERAKFQEEMAAKIGRLKGMEDALRKRACQEKRQRQAQVLWSAADALLLAISSPNPCKPKEGGDNKGGDDEEEDKDADFRPLGKEVAAVRNATGDEDQLVNAVLEAIPTEALQRGVFTKAALKERFSHVQRVAKRVALLAEGGASLPTMFIAYVASFLVISPANPIPCYELADEPFDASELNNFEVLQRAQYWMDHGDLYKVLQYMNLLKGASKVISRDFVKELTMYLETKQAGEVLKAYASASGMAN